MARKPYVDWSRQGVTRTYLPRRLHCKVVANAAVALVVALELAVEVAADWRAHIEEPRNATSTDGSVCADVEATPSNTLRSPWSCGLTLDRPPLGKCRLLPLVLAAHRFLYCHGVEAHLDHSAATGVASPAVVSEAKVGSCNRWSHHSRHLQCTMRNPTDVEWCGRHDCPEQALQYFRLRPAPR
eukprot:scaffold265269_cov30-Tisochrysis_lutea.AAC.3